MSRFADPQRGKCRRGRRRKGKKVDPAPRQTKEEQHDGNRAHEQVRQSVERIMQIVLGFGKKTEGPVGMGDQRNDRQQAKGTRKPGQHKAQPRQ